MRGCVSEMDGYTTTVTVNHKEEVTYSILIFTKSDDLKYLYLLFVELWSSFKTNRVELTTARPYCQQQNVALDI